MPKQKNKYGIYVDFNETARNWGFFYDVVNAGWFDHPQVEFVGNTHHLYASPYSDDTRDDYLQDANVQAMLYMGYQFEVMDECRYSPEAQTIHFWRTEEARVDFLNRLEDSVAGINLRDVHWRDRAPYRERRWAVQKLKNTVAKKRVTSFYEPQGTVKRALSILIEQEIL